METIVLKTRPISTLASRFGNGIVSFFAKTFLTSKFYTERLTTMADFTQLIFNEFHLLTNSHQFEIILAPFKQV